MSDPVAGTARAPIDVTRMFPEIAQIVDATLRRAVIEVWEELWSASPWTDIGAVPTNTDVPYPTLPHNQSVMTMALAVADAFERFHGLTVNRDYLIAAAALQDASKVLEYSPEPGGAARLSEVGRLYPHAFWTAHLAAQKGMPHEVVHMILTHTPQSATFPSTLEGKILYYVDQIDVLAIHKDRWRKDIVLTRQR